MGCLRRAWPAPPALRPAQSRADGRRGARAAAFAAGVNTAIPAMLNLLKLIPAPAESFRRRRDTLNCILLSAHIRDKQGMKQAKNRE